MLIVSICMGKSIRVKGVKELSGLPESVNFVISLVFKENTVSCFICTGGGNQHGTSSKII